MANKKQPAPPKFAAGDRVYVKQGVMDPDYPDMPLILPLSLILYFKA